MKEQLLNTKKTFQTKDRTLQSIRKSNDKAERIDVFVNTMLEMLEKYNIDK